MEVKNLNTIKNYCMQVDMSCEIGTKKRNRIIL